jgi:hypothetical protein
MGTTTNNGWTYPESTDLVKDGATAIQTLADDIDTTLGVYAPSTSALTLINTTTFTAVASQSINDVFSATYDNYFIQGNFTPASGQEIYYRLRVAGADATGSNYANQQFKGVSASSIADASSSANGLFSVNNSTRHVASAFFYSPFAAVPTFSLSNFYDLAPAVGQLGVNHTLSTSYTGITFYTSGGANMTGTVSIFGVAK